MKEVRRKPLKGNIIMQRHQCQKYQPYARDPSLSGAFATYFWELTLLSKHCHPTISHDQVYRASVSPEQAFTDMKVDYETFVLKGGQKSNNKRKRGSKAPPLVAAGGGDVVDEEVVKNKLGEHFVLVHDMEENERLRREVERVKLGFLLTKRTFVLPKRKSNKVMKFLKKYLNV